MRRREFIHGLCGVVPAWPHLARAQQQSMPVVGFLHAGSLELSRQQIAAFRAGLRDAGYIEGQSVAVELRFAEDRLDQLPALASDLARRQVAVLFAGTNDAALAAKQATKVLPTVFVVGADPVELGLVASFNRPGGNMTGFHQFTAGLEGKRLGLLHEMVSKPSTIAVLVHKGFLRAEFQERDVREAAARLGVHLVVLHANQESDFDAAFTTLVQKRAGALLVCSSPFFTSRREQLVALAARHAVPAIYEWREFAAAGGLMSYGTRLVDIYRQAGVYAGQILKGAKPTDMPVVQPTRFELMLNLKTAKALGIDIPAVILAIADELIE